MQNVYMTPLKYKNFNGVEKTTKLHFHLTPREFADWMIDHKEEADLFIATFTDVSAVMEANPEGEASESQKLAMLRLVRLLAELSYGVPSDDGEVFDKSELSKFIHSAKYDAFRLFLFENVKELNTFITTLLNDQVIEEFSNRMQASTALTEQAQPAGAEVRQLPTGPKDPKDMTREELLKAMQEKTRPQQ